MSAFRIIKGTPKTKEKEQEKKRATYFWSSDEVCKWLKNHAPEYHGLYSEKFTENDISGRCLLNLNDWKLNAIGVKDNAHREDLMRHILRLKLKTELSELSTLDKALANNPDFKNS
ncbi:DgyrCDS635 [Dimorphilus gyrociliatus]|uniref:DgyrCDS635 n=1 Tax=Dimorphilus gyrociliatus TaxID=2664684 RepID=A0A7I8V5A5_9ANNE|nr:DgyrCDS635 [Dimorphilus gyrociliatus]